MKKLLLIFGFGLFLLASCKKDYTCTCTLTEDGVSYPEYNTSTTINDTKSKAKDACDKLDVAEDAVLGIGQNCEIQ